ncbi:MAG: adenylate/guanylate cyclase domain-containing protein [Chloroflexota bacterium]
MRELPRGTVTLLFTDIEGSTRLLHELGDGYAALLAEHRQRLREAFSSHGGVEVDTQGDAFFYAFTRAQDALAGAAEAQRALGDGRIQVRMGVHTGEPLLTEEGYVGIDVHRAARVMAAGHGGQVLVSAATAALVDGADLRDLGERRLKDMTAPQRLFQLGDREFPPLKTLDATNLPVAASPLIGRDAEVAEAVDLLMGGTRVLTVTGTGGIGKTRLALQVASELVGRFADGVFWIPMAQLTDPELVLPEIGKALGQTDVVAHLRDRTTLLLLDNGEQLPDLGPRLAELLATAPRCHLLVTSRAPLRIAGERELPLAPLASGAAVTLFVERARAVGSRIEPSEVVARICRRLDELPLAIELAAARIKLMDPAALDARLDHRLAVLTGGRRDAPERQRTLRATIEWSHDLLADAGRELFMRLAVFVGGASLEAVEAVCEADLDAIEMLVDMSLLKSVDGGRLLMLETLREYAAERLAASGEEGELRRRHATWYAELAERLDAERRLPGEGARAAGAMEADRANIRAAADWAGATGEHALQLRLLSADRDMFLRGPHGWLRAALDTALAAVDDPALRARGLATLSFNAYRQGDLEAAAAAAQESLDLSEQLGDPVGVATAHNYLANVDNARGRFDDARRHLEQALEASRAAGDTTGVAITLINLSDIALTAGEFDLGRSLALEGRDAAGQDGDPHVVQIALLNAATGAVRAGHVDEAAAHARAGIAMGVESDDPLTIATGMRILAAVAAQRGELSAAARLMGCAAARDEALEATLEPTEQALVDLVLEQAAALGPEVLAAELSAGRDLQLEEALAL